MLIELSMFLISQSSNLKKKILSAETSTIITLE